MNSVSKVKNYTKYKVQILALLALNTPCFECKARSVCDKISKDKGIEKEKSKAPCEEAWLKWADLTD